MRAQVRWLLLTLLTAIGSGGCGPTVDLANGLELLDVSTGWLDEGVVDGENKLVPRVQFRVKNVSDQPLVSLRVMGVFRRMNETEEVGSNFVSVTRSNALNPGETSEVQSIKSNFGYKAAQPRADMLKNDHFVDATVDLRGAYAAVQWTKIAEYPIERRLLTK